MPRRVHPPHMVFRFLGEHARDGRQRRDAPADQRAEEEGEAKITRCGKETGKAVRHGRVGLDKLLHGLRPGLENGAN